MKITRKNWGWIVFRLAIAAMGALFAYDLFGEHGVTWAFLLFILAEVYFISDKLDDDKP